jgi:hypothetical protein
VATPIAPTLNLCREESCLHGRLEQLLSASASVSAFWLVSFSANFGHLNGVFRSGVFRTLDCAANDVTGQAGMFSYPQLVSLSSLLLFRHG